MLKIITSLLIFVGLTVASMAQLNLSFTTTQPTCYGFNDGSIDLTVSGDTLPYTVEWYNNSALISNLEDLSNLYAGQYIVVVTDSIGSNASDTVNLNNTYQITTVDTIADALCYSSAGTINITPQNGFGFYTGILYPQKWDPYQQLWLLDSAGVDTLNTNVDTLNFLWSVVAGRYSIYITDNTGSTCFIEKTIEIHQPSSPVTFNKTFYHNICKDDSSGWIKVVPDGGTPPYTYSWSVGSSLNQISDLKAGLYTVTVSDSKGCRKTETIAINEPFQPIILIADTLDVSCRDNKDGEISIMDIENAKSPYTYTWSTGTTDNFINELDSGLYSITVTDANNCRALRDFHIGMKDCDCITIYNVITPDGNGKNDTWEIKNIQLYPQAKVKVFNRWGTLVYSSTNGYDNSWDGKYNGSLLDSGDYYYIVILNSRDYPPYTGPLKILK
ncbi:MAG: gliding motility-associated C-terminal domain-containing protein [Bacteroidota bacterium]